MRTFCTALTPLVLLLQVLVASASGELITIGLRAEVTYIDQSAYDLLEGHVQLGDTLTGTYTYDSQTPDSNPLSGVGDYYQDSAPCGIRLEAGGIVFESDPDILNFLIELNDNHVGEDNYLLRSYSNLPLPNGVEVDHISWQLDDPSCTALSSDALPLGPPVLSDWQYQGLSIELGPKGGANIGAQVTCVWLIPEPATVLLLGCGSVLLLRKRRRGSF